MPANTYPRSLFSPFFKVGFALPAGRVSLFVLFALCAFASLPAPAQAYSTLLDSTTEGLPTTEYQVASAHAYSGRISNGTYTLGSMRASIVAENSSYIGTSVYFQLSDDSGPGYKDCTSQTFTPTDTGYVYRANTSTATELSDTVFVFTGTECTFTESGTQAWQAKLRGSTNVYLLLTLAGTNAYAIGYEGTYSPGGGVSGDGYDFTHVIRINEPVSYGTTTTTFDVSFDAIINSDDASSTDGYVLGFLSEDGNYTFFEYLIPTGWVADSPFNISTTSTLATGAYHMTVRLVGGMIDALAYGTPLYYGPDGGFTAPGVEFAVSSTTYGSVVFPAPATRPYYGPQFASTSCAVNFLGTFNLGDCVGYLSQPNASSTQNFTAVTDNMSRRAPFIYAYQIGQMRNELFSASSTASSSISVTVDGFGNITFISRDMVNNVPFSNTIKLILAALIWLLGAQTIYLTVIRSHNSNTGV